MSLRDDAEALATPSTASRSSEQSVPSSSQETSPSNEGFSRRQFMQRAGLGVLAAGAGLAPSSAPAGGQAGSNGGGNGNRPNILLLITDQERYPQNWPVGWAEKNLPNRKRLADNGLTFTHAFCNAAMCSPSRATLFTGLYLTQHGVEHTLTTGGCLSEEEPTLQTTTQNMARMLATAGYNVQIRGKWHMTKDVSSLTDASSAGDLEKFGFYGWQPPDAGQDSKPQHFGGGCTDYDTHWAQQAADFLQSKEAKSGQPFALIVSFVNPHDTLAYPKSWDQQVGNAQNGYCYNYLKDAAVAFDQGISLPVTYDECLDKNYKPQAQVQSKALLNAGLGVLLDDTGPLINDQPLKYVNFYAYLHIVSDNHIGTVIDALQADPSLYNKTIVIRVSDHGEMGLSHNGLRQKLFNVYEETMRVPIVISNPRWFPKPARSDTLVSLIDIMPTLATLANVPNRSHWDFKGRDLTPLIQDAIQNPTNPTASVQDSILFMFDDDNPGAANPQPYVTEPCHIRCIRDTHYKYAVYFDPCPTAVESELELYDLLNDPLELNNLANPKNTANYNQALVEQMQAKLDAKMAETGVTWHPSTPFCGCPSGCSPCPPTITPPPSC
jgi:arylsulfatase A-like enzyme